jgi:hypothetical protein
VGKTEGEGVISSEGSSSKKPSRLKRSSKESIARISRAISSKELVTVASEESA